MLILMIYLATVNALGFLLMLVDKQKARKNRWRIPEKTLLGVAAIGGSLGSLTGMYLFRHKTLHKRFTIGIPLMLIAQIMLFIYVMSAE